MLIQDNAFTISMPRMRFHARHGVMPQEQQVGGEFMLSLVLHIDGRNAHHALCHDELEGTINYAEVYDIVGREMKQPSQLIERVAARVARCLLRHFFTLRQVDVEVTKCVPPIPGFDGEGVTVRYSLRRQLVAWDFDGTIADTSRGIVQTMSETFRRMGWAVPSDEAICSTIGLPLQASVAQLAALPCGNDEVQRATALYRVLFEQVGTAGVTLFPGVDEEMCRQHESGMFVAIATSRGHDSVRCLLEQLGVLCYVDYIVACEDVIAHKPDSAPVERLCELTNVLPADTTVIGDTTFDIEMGRNARVGRCIGVEWGNHSRKMLIDAGADFVLENF